MEGGWTLNLTLESNEYQSYILKFASNVVQKLCDLLGGRGGGGEVIKRSHWITGGRGGGQDGPKKDHIIFERSIQDPFVVRPFLVFFGQWCVGTSGPARLVQDIVPHSDFCVFLLEVCTSCQVPSKC